MMVLLLNLVFALSGGYLAYIICIKAGIGQPIHVIIGVIVGFIVFMQNFAGKVL